MTHGRLSAGRFVLATLHLLAVPCFFTFDGAQAAPSRERTFHSARPGSLMAARVGIATGDVRLQAAVRRLVAEADGLLQTAPPSVTQKIQPAPSGDRHDYASLAPYYWPDPATPSGLPYLRRDGRRNPESRDPAANDRERVSLLGHGIETLALAWHFTGDAAYARKAAEFARTWFIAAETRMNPHLRYAQAVRGTNEGRPAGILEGRDLAQALDALSLLADANVLTASEWESIDTWGRDYLDWLLTSEPGRKEREASNNHGTYYDLQAAWLALAVGRDDLASEILGEVGPRRIATQIEPDGSQPHELIRTKSLGYALFNLRGLQKLATLGDHVGIDLWRFTTPDGRSIQGAIDHLLPFLGPDPKPWPAEQIEPIPADEAASVVWRAARVLGEPQFTALAASASPADDRLQLFFAVSQPVRRRLRDGWEHYRGTLGSVWEVWRGERASDNVPWTAVRLPHCFNARDCVDPDERYYQGPGWYRARLEIEPAPPRGRTLLHFDGAGQETTVFVGLDEVARHLGGYDEWTVDITDAADRVSADETFLGRIPVAIRCDNSRSAESIPSDLSDFNRYGGLYRHVHLEQVPAVSLERVHVKPVLVDGEGSVTVLGRLRNPDQLADELTITIEIRNPAGGLIHRQVVQAQPWEGMRELAEVALDSPATWSPAKPRLHRCTVAISSTHGSHRVAERFGLRSVEWVPHGPFRLNGQRLLLRGTHYHEDHAGTAAAVPDIVVRRTLTQIKEMGANFVRLGHYQQAPLVLDLCDELGLLVWEEIPWCRGGLGGDRYREQCRGMLRAMIDQHHNHPSVILWGLGNENDWPGDFPAFDKQAIREFMAELDTLAHELDPTRKTAIRRCDFCKDVIDVYSPSIWAGWYSGRYREYRTAVEKAIAATPHFFHAEWGGDSHAGRFAEDPERMLEQVAVGQGTAEVGKAYKSTGGKVRMSKDGDWSESYMVNLFDWHLHEQEQMPNLTGSAAWIFKDFSTPLRPENPLPRVNQKGVVSRDGTPKESYYVFQSYWAEEPMVHVLGHGWRERWGTEGEIKEIRVYSNCPEVELFVDDKSAGRKRRKGSDFPAAGLRWSVPLAAGRHVVRAVADSAAGPIADEIAFDYRVEPWGPPEKLVLAEVAREASRITLEAAAVDSGGAVCLDAAHVVRFAAVGGIELIDNLGTPGGSRVVQLANGRARIDLVAGGRGVAVVSSPGLDSAFLDLIAPPADEAAAIRFGLDLVAHDRERILRAADAALTMTPPALTTARPPHPFGGPNDFHSSGDYWWPDPTKPDGLPYVRRDGETNPDNFIAHRAALARLRDAVAALAAARLVTGNDRYAAKADELLRVFFLDPATRMNPHLAYAQGVPGVSPGRAVGIIDGLHLIEVARAVKVLAQEQALPPTTVTGLTDWFADLCDWMVTSENGRQEAAAKNNHAVAYFVQLAAFADLTGDEAILAECRRQFREVFLPEQMATDGSFPRELARTKPYGYSIFQLDQLATLCQILSTDRDDLWRFELADGRGIRRAVTWLRPALADKTAWPLPPDVEHWDGWPARQPHLLFAALACGDAESLAIWQRLPADPGDPEVRRNIPITQPLLWVESHR
jgi:beta-galactosidase